MTNATVRDFIEETQKLNPGKEQHLKVGNGIDRVIYTGGDPRDLKVPYPFAWNEEMQGFSDLETLNSLGLTPMYQLFTVHRE